MPPDARACRHKLVLITSNQTLARRTAAALLELIEPPADAVSVFEEGALPRWRLDAYFTTEPDPEAIARAVAGVTASVAPTFVLELVPDENWVQLSQEALPPVVAGRFTVLGSHDRQRVPRGPGRIVIDAGEAFGTAHHATTLGCLLALDRLTRRRRFSRVLDLGCGSGVLAIAAQRALPRACVVASDVDSVAVAVARANVRINAALAVRVILSDGVPRRALARDNRYDLMIANILARPLIALAPAITQSLEPGGVLILSGLLSTHVRQVLAAYLPRGFMLVRHERIVGWSTLELMRGGLVRDFEGERKGEWHLPAPLPPSK